MNINRELVALGFEPEDVKYQRVEDLFFDERFDQINNISRWNGMLRLKEETVAHHSFIVAWFARVLSEEIFNHSVPKLTITSFALFHDFDEIFTGDIIHPVKYNQFNGTEIRKLLNEYNGFVIDNEFPKHVSKSNNFMNVMLKDEVPMYAKAVVKLCDWLSMKFYLLKEIKLGNHNVFKEYKYCSDNIEKAVETAVFELSLQKDYDVNLSIFECFPTHID